jgi:hypothetical protein
MRIPTSTTVALVLLAGAVGYYLGVKNRTVEADAWGFVSQKVAFSNRYDCELEAQEQDAEDLAKGRALAAAHPELLAKMRADPSFTPPSFYEFVRKLDCGV